MSIDPHGFSSDRPIEHFDEDKLNREPFARLLADAISRWSGKDSLVLALNGEWGSGKSSVKNLLLSTLAESKLKQPYIVEFNPWEWAGQETISKAFFEQISRSLGSTNGNKNLKKVAKKIRAYGRYLNSGESLISGIAAAAPNALAAGAALSSAVATDPTYKNISLLVLSIALAWSAALKWGSGMAESLAKLIEGRIEEPTLPQIKAQLSKALKSLSMPVLVIVDDIDRLRRDETRLLFQLVKANGDFPNVVYLLLYQRDIVEEMLNEPGGATGRAYLEKIIQVPFDMPAVEQSRLANELFSNLSRILDSDPRIAKRFNERRWVNLYDGALQTFFTTLRNVYRYAGTLSFYAEMLKGERAFEANPIDLIAMECLRFFEPQAYREIASSKELLTKLHDRSRATAIAAEIDKIVAMVSEDRRESMRELLKQVFPPIEFVFGGYSYSGDSREEWFRELRVCHPEVFDRYFLLSLPKESFSQSELDEVLELAADRQGLTIKLNSLRLTGRLKVALSQLDSYKQDIPLTVADTFIPALMDIADNVEDTQPGFMVFSPHLHLVRIVLWYLKKYPARGARGQKLLWCFNRTEGLSLMRDLVLGEENRRAKAHPVDDLLMDDVTFEVAKALFVSRVRALAFCDPLALRGNHFLASILVVWRKWGRAEEVAIWCDAQVIGPSDLLSFLRSFTSVSTSYTAGDVVSRTRHRISLAAVEQFLPFDKIRMLASGIPDTGLDADEEQTRRALTAALRRREAGEPEDDFGDDEDDDDE